MCLNDLINLDNLINRCIIKFEVIHPAGFGEKLLSILNYTTWTLHNK